MRHRASIDFSALADLELVDQFVKWADAAGEAALDGDPQKMRQAAYRLRELSDVFRARGREVRLMLIPLLGHPKQGVRYYSAKHLLAIAPERARSVIEQVAAGVGPIAGAAGMIPAYSNRTDHRTTARRELRGHYDSASSRNLSDVGIPGTQYPIGLDYQTLHRSFRTISAFAGQL